LIVASASIAVIYVVMDSKCKEINKANNDSRSEIEKLVKEHRNQEHLWKNNHTPEVLSEVLLRHGHEMVYSPPEQTVRMDASGVPVEGQASLRKFREDWIGGAVLMDKPKP